MLGFYVKHSGDEELRTVDEPPHEHGWVYGASITAREQQRVVDTYELNSNIVSDIRDQYELPRVEYGDGALYVFARVPYQSAHGTVISKPFLAVLKNSLLITLSTTEYIRPSDIIGVTNLTTKNNPHLLIQLLRHVVTQYGGYINEVGTYTHNTSQRLKTKEVTNEDFIHFVSLESELREYNISLSGMRTVLDRLHENKRNNFSETDIELIEDVDLHINQLLTLVTNYTDTITSIRNAYATITNNNLNRRIKTLTILTVIVMLPGVFYGMFGMNVKIPGMHNPWSFAYIVGFTVVLVSLVAWIIKRKKF
jgi:magnesium transporter